MNTSEDFWSRTRADGSCVIWTGALDSDGYGSLKWLGRGRSAHRVAFFLRLGRWPDGLLRHLCHRPACVLHVVEGSVSENALDSVAQGSHKEARKTHCPAGHPYDEANTRRSTTPGKGRVCRACHRESERQRYAAKKKLPGGRSNPAP